MLSVLVPNPINGSASFRPGYPHVLQIADRDAALATNGGQLDKIATQKQIVPVGSHDSLGKRQIRLVAHLVNHRDLIVG